MTEFRTSMTSRDVAASPFAGLFAAHALVAWSSAKTRKKGIGGQRRNRTADTGIFSERVTL